MTFTPSPAELALVTQIFAKADPQKIGILTGDAALKVFGGAKLPPTVLGEIWSIADEDNNGWLPRKGVAIAVRLMGWAQKGEKVTEALVARPGPLPTIEGIQAPLSQQNTGISLPRSPPPALPVLTPQDKAKYMGIFQGCKPKNGILTGEQARDVFVKSKLPVEKLGQIWNLADTQNRGALDSTDFAIGMYLIKASMSGQLSFIPTSLPPGLYEQASGGGIASHGTGSSGSYNIGSFTPTRVAQQYTGPGALQVQTTGQKRVPPLLPSRKPSVPIQASNAFSNAATPFLTGQPAWDVTAAEKASADRFFDTLDSQKLGYIEGDVAVPFMLQSNLPEDILAHVWDLADINNDGRLTRDGFAVAMHLIQGKLAGKEVPTSLPSSLIPPSMRANGATSFSAPPPQEQANLLWDDTPPPSASPVRAQSQNPVFPSPPISPPKPQAPVQDPFGSASFAVPSSRNLLEDDEPTSSSSPPLQDQSAEIGNVQNQLNSTNRSLKTAKAEREQVQQTLATQASQLSALQTQLSSAKAAYETETKLLSTLRDRLGSQTVEIQKAREELIRAESDLSAMRVEKAEIEGAFLRDKEDVRDLHRKMAETGTEVAGLKVEIEKAKKEAKQQKGLLAIARKQLTTKETEKTKVQKELEDAHGEVKEVTTERESVEAELAKDFPAALQNGPDISHSAQSPQTDSITAALAQPLPASLPVSPDPASPSATSMKSNNPFDRLTRSASSASSPRSQSVPFADAASVPTPPAAPVEATEDSFGFLQAFSEEPAATPTPEKESESAVTEAGTTTPRQDPTTLSIPPVPTEEQTISPGSEFGSEFYSTPPSTAAGLSQSPPTNRMSEVPSIDSQFPPLDSIPGSFPMSEDRHGGESDLAALKELDVEESDSDSDEEPLSDVKQKLQTSADNGPSKAAPPNGISIPSTSFDDAFGASTFDPGSTNLDTPKPSAVPEDSLASSITPEAPSTDAFGAPLIKASNPFPAIGDAGPTPVTGVNAFDEAMGKIPSNGVGTSAPSISFDSAFEDNFDFASASPAAPRFPQPPGVANGNGHTTSSSTFTPTGFEGIYGAPANNGTPSLPSVDAPKQLSFEDAFSVESSAPKPASQPALPIRKASLGPAAAISFDDAFGGVDSSQALKLDNTFGSALSKTSAATSSTRQSQPAGVPKPFPAAQSPPLSPQGGPSSPRISSIRSSSPPPRSLSPPARLGSPGPRPSTSSSKDGHEKLKEPGTRHSRLSIRLPFGKKKSKESKDSPVPPPVPPSHYNQFLSPVEEPSGPTTVAVEDDVDSVKQLCGMGFSRSQAVNALEKHGYDMQKALNSLLGAQ